jgi:hypothetical protein
MISHNSMFFVLIMESYFIDLFYSFEEDGSSLPIVVVFVFVNLQVNE